MTAIRNQQSQGNNNKTVYGVYQFSLFWCFFHQCSFNSFATTIFARNLVIHWFKRRRNKVTNNKWDLIVYYTSFLYMKATSWGFSLFHPRSLSKDSNKSAHLAVSLEPLPNRKCGFVYRKLLSFGIAVQIRKVQTHWLVD